MPDLLPNVNYKRSFERYYVHINLIIIIIILQYLNHI